jgi:hypothetical protein
MELPLRPLILRSGAFDWTLLAGFAVIGRGV